MSIEEPSFRPGSRPQRYVPGPQRRHVGAEEPATREYIGWINLGDGNRISLSVLAADVDEAYERVVEQHGEGHELSIWNEEEAHTMR
ncbi:hypothetical protein AB0J72_21745 [Dactylosporangium sp. NPDC049742]|uniref:hypothetical protein n=1 Tax=Dactylosporangium sp. NPDC049742 TaxID=3154737 RepID=UPI00344062A0